jgi:hypothetical protein
MKDIPSNEIAEKALLGLLLSSKTSISELEAQGITADHFHCYRIPFDEIATFTKKGGGDVTLLVMQAHENGTLDDIGGAHFFTSTALEGSASALPSYVQALRQSHGKRLVMQAGGKLASNPTDPEAIAQIIAGQAEIDLASNTRESIYFDCIHHDDISDTEGAFDFVEDVLSDGCASVIYGASNSGKTFFAIDLAAHVATGREWQGKEVEQGAVIYIALEGRTGAMNRIKAMRSRGILPKGAPFFLCFSPVNLLDPTHPEAIKRTIESVTESAGLPVRIVIIDTLARAMAGGDENSGKDMGEAVKTIDAARQATGAHVCIIHHCGKDVAKGARGHSSLRAAIDTEIEVIHPEGDIYRTASVVKQRDLATIPPLVFSLEPVEVGINRRGKPITSCVVKTEDSIMAHVKGKAGAKKQFTCEMILDLLPQPDTTAWQIAATKKHGMSKDTFGDRKRECASQWHKVGNQILLKPLKNQGEWGNGGIDF